MNEPKDPYASPSPKSEGGRSGRQEAPPSGDTPYLPGGGAEGGRWPGRFSPPSASDSEASTPWTPTPWTPTPRTEPARTERARTEPERTGAPHASGPWDTAPSGGAPSGRSGAATVQGDTSRIPFPPTGSAGGPQDFAQTSGTPIPSGPLNASSGGSPETQVRFPGQFEPRQETARQEPPSRLGSRAKRRNTNGQATGEDPLLPGRPVPPKHASQMGEGQGHALPGPAFPGAASSAGPRAAGESFPGVATPPGSSGAHSTSPSGFGASPGASGGPQSRSSFYGTPSFGGPQDPVQPVAGGGGGRKGPSWMALIGAMIVTAMATVLAVFAISPNGLDVWGGGERPTDPSKPSSEDKAESIQSGTELVPPVTDTIPAPDWQAVAEAVRPATVSIMAEGLEEAASGSGVIIDNEGHIISNHHVVAGAQDGGSLTVTTYDGKLYKAQIVGADPTTDLAVIKLENVPDNLVAARLGDSNNLEVGQPVMAIGAPLGLADTTTTGVISALNRPVAVQASTDGVNPAEQEVVVTNAIQIDASINPGNSGGPLFDEHGSIIGINFSIASVASQSDAAGSIGLGFAIPVDLVKSVVDQIINTGSVRHALLGVEIQTVSVGTDEEQRLGAQVATVSEGGAAHGAGLQPGDVIVAIDGHQVVSGPSLTGYVRRYQAGDEVTLVVVRDGQDMTVHATLQER